MNVKPVLAQFAAPQNKDTWAARIKSGDLGQAGLVLVFVFIAPFLCLVFHLTAGRAIRKRMARGKRYRALMRPVLNMERQKMNEQNPSRNEPEN